MNFDLDSFLIGVLTFPTAVLVVGIFATAILSVIDRRGS